MPSEDDEVKSEGGEEGETIVDKVQAFFYTDDDFADFFEQWCKDHCEIIDPDSEECKLEYTDLYQDFLRVFEEKLTDFIEMNGSSVEKFYECLRTAEKNSNYDIFCQIMNATIDFDVFVQMMKETAVQERREKK